jgi:hypothetical protein
MSVLPTPSLSASLNALAIVSFQMHFNLVPFHEIRLLDGRRISQIQHLIFSQLL